MMKQTFQNPDVLIALVVKLLVSMSRLAFRALPLPVNLSHWSLSVGLSPRVRPLIRKPFKYKLRS